MGNPRLSNPVDVVPGDQHLAAGRLDLADQRPDQGGLPAARRPDDEGELAAVEGKRHSLDTKVPAGIDDADVPQLDDGRPLTGSVRRAVATRPRRRRITRGAAPPSSTCSERGHAKRVSATPAAILRRPPAAISHDEASAEG